MQCNVRAQELSVRIRVYIRTYAARSQVAQVTELPADEYFVFMLSDAMLEQYKVQPQVRGHLSLAKANYCV
jgi:hypothetical protein